MTVSGLPDGRVQTGGRWLSPMLATATNVSQNEKIGEAGATCAAQGSCPGSCPFKDGGGCYAESGRLGQFVTRELNLSAEVLVADALAIAEAEAHAIDALTITLDRPLRLHTVGDCASDETARLVAQAAARYMARGGGQVWTYTHAWAQVKRESWGDVAVLASCETTEQIFWARQAGYATSVVVEEFPSPRRYVLKGEPLGQDVIPCPAQTKGIVCTDCKLCFDATRLRRQGLTIGFALHGIPLAVRQARMALRNPDDPDRRIPSEERIRRIREEFLTGEGREPTVREVAELIDLNESSVWEWLRFIRGEIPHPAIRHRKPRKPKLRREYRTLDEFRQGLSEVHPEA